MTPTPEKGAPERIWLRYMMGETLVSYEPSDCTRIEYIRADAAREIIAREIEAESKELHAFVIQADGPRQREAIDYANDMVPALDRVARWLRTHHPDTQEPTS